MKIVATPIPSGTAVTLGDNSVGDFIIDPPPLPVERRQVQEEPLVMADRAWATGRGNRHTSWSWTVARLHADQPTADAFVWTHGPSVPINCSLQITDPGGTWNFSSAVIEEVAIIEQTGVSTKTRYTVRGATPS